MAFDLQKLKDLSKRIGGILVMDGNNPEFVILSYESFMKSESESNSQVAQPQQMGISEEEQQMIESLNKEIEALKEEIRQKETEELIEEPSIV